jgi:uncharacterized membrane protein
MRPYGAGPMFWPPGAWMPGPMAQQQLQVWKGQFPPPQAMEHYEKVLPGSVDRMIKMAEELQKAQIEQSSRALTFALSAGWLHWPL